MQLSNSNKTKQYQHFSIVKLSCSCKPTQTVMLHKNDRVNTSASYCLERFTYSGVKSGRLPHQVQKMFLSTREADKQCYKVDQTVLKLQY